VLRWHSDGIETGARRPAAELGELLRLKLDGLTGRVVERRACP
jgi:hypothetical protein